MSGAEVASFQISAGTLVQLLDQDLLKCRGAGAIPREAMVEAVASVSYASQMRLEWLYELCQSLTRGR